MASRTGGVPEIIRDGLTGILVEPGNPAELAKGIIFLLRDREKRLSMGQAAKELVLGSFSAENMVKQIEGLYVDCRGALVGAKTMISRIGQPQGLPLHHWERIWRVI